MRLFVFCLSVSLYAQSADIILHHGKIVTVDPQFHIADAIAITMMVIAKNFAIRLPL